MKNKIQKFKEKYKFLFENFQKFFPLIFLVFVIELLMNLTEVFVPFFSKLKLDQLELQNREMFGINFNSPAGLFIAIVVFEGITMVFIRFSNIFRSFFNDLVSYKVDSEIKIKIYKRFFNFDYGIFLNPKSSALLWSVDGMSYILKSITDYFFNFISVFIELVSIGGILLFIDYRIIPIVFFTTILSAVIRKKRYLSEVERRIKNTPLRNKLNTLSSSLTGNFHRLILAGASKEIILKQTELISERRKIDLENFKINNFYGILEEFIFLISQSIIYVFLGFLVLDQKITIGTFGMILAYSTRIGSTFSRISDFGRRKNDLILELAKIRFVLEIKSKLDFSNIDESIKNISVQKIKILNLIFKYPRFSDLELRYLKESVDSIKITKKDDWLVHMKERIEKFILEEKKENKVVLKNINLEFKIGEITALVGRNGSGKTTITNLLLRGFDPDSGDIQFDDFDLKNIHPEIVRSNISILQQEPFFIHDFSIRENLLIGANRDVSDEELWNILEKVKLKNFIESAPKKLNTTSEDDFQPSGGQEQMLAIARVLVQNRPVIIFDEGTNQLDAEKEMEVLKILQSIKKDKIIIFITHRITTAKKADKIYSIDDGKVVEVGTHEDLVKNQNGIYKKFWDLQVVE